MEIRTFFKQIQWAWQRLTRGYDDRLFWDMESYLDPIILAGVTHLRKYNHGFPNGLTQKKWNSILDKIIVGFQPEPVNIKDYKKWYKKKTEALVLFAYYYNNLWD